MKKIIEIIKSIFVKENSTPKIVKEIKEPERKAPLHAYRTKR